MNYLLLAYACGAPENLVLNSHDPAIPMVFKDANLALCVEGLLLGKSCRQQALGTQKHFPAELPLACLGFLA